MWLWGVWLWWVFIGVHSTKCVFMGVCIYRGKCIKCLREYGRGGVYGGKYIV